MVTHRRMNFFIMLISNLPSVRVRSSWYKGKRGRWREREREWFAKFFFVLSSHSVLLLSNAIVVFVFLGVVVVDDGYVQPPRQRCRRRPPPSPILFSSPLSLFFVFFRVLPSLRLPPLPTDSISFRVHPSSGEWGSHLCYDAYFMRAHRLFFLRFNNFLSMHCRSANEKKTRREKKNESLRPAWKRTSRIESKMKRWQRHIVCQYLNFIGRREEKLRRFLLPVKSLQEEKYSPLKDYVNVNLIRIETRQNDGFYFE